MTTDDLRPELERIYETVRAAFANYELDDALAYLQVPEDEPRPTVEQAHMMAEFLPALSQSRFLELRREGERAALYYETEVEEPSCSEVTVIRFDVAPSGIRLAPGPHTMSSYGGDPTDEAGLRRWIETEPSLRAAAWEDASESDPG